jgi:competence protein ComEC
VSGTPETTPDPATTSGSGLDLRLVPAALGAWACSLLGLWVGWEAAAVAALIGVLLVMLGVGVPWLRPTAPGRASAGLLALGAALLAGGAGAAVQAHDSAANPVRVAAESGSAATLRVRVTDDPRPLHSAGFGSQQGGARQVVVSAKLRNAEVDGRHWSVGGRVVLIAPADQWAALLPGQEVSAAGLLAPPMRRDLTVAALRVRGPPVEVGPPPWWQRAAADVRGGLRDATQVLPEQPAGLLPGLVVGDTSRLPPEVSDEFKTAGLSHLTAVSGTNVAIVCGAVLWLFRLLRFGPRTCAVLAGVALVGFVVLARPSPSVLRAAVMGAIALLALMVGRRRSAMPALAAAVLGLLLVDPELGVEPGFALSVLATCGLVVLAPPWAAALRERGVPAGVAEAITVPVAAHVVTAPVVVALAGNVSMVAIVANLLAAPAVVPATVLGVLAAVLATVHAGAAEIVVRVAGPAVQWLIAVGDRSAAIPGATIGWTDGARGGLLLAVITIVGLVLLRFRRFRALMAAGGLGALLVFVPTRFTPPGWPVDGWALVACDVGQGDALVLAAGGAEARAIVVDTGPDPGLVGGCLDRLDVQRIPLVVLSHLHADHVGGLAGVLAGRSVGAVAIGPLREPSWAFEQVRRLTRQAAVPLVELRAGQRMAWPELTIEVLGPSRPPPVVDDDGTLVNDASLVLRADTAAGRVLLTGDVELGGQAELLAAGVDLGADVLKMPHHGSRFSSPRFLAAVRPRLAVVSVGAGNPYGHPNDSAVGALTSAGAKVMRTDQHGDIAVAGGRERPLVVGRGAREPSGTDRGASEPSGN